MTRRWSERLRRALTDLRNGGDVQEGGEEGVAVKSFSCPVQLIVLCYFIQSHDKHTRFYFNLTLEYKAYYSSYTQN